MPIRPTGNGTVEVEGSAEPLLFTGIPEDAARTQGAALAIDLSMLETQASSSTSYVVWQSNDNRIYADAGQGTEDPGNAPTGPVSGWYWDNPVNEKINWYEADINPKFGDLSGYAAWVRYDEINSLTFLAIYTMPQNDGNDVASWYRSRVILIINSAGNVAQYEDCIATWRSDPSGVNPALQRLTMTVDPTTTLLSTGGSDISTIANEQVCLLAFSTSSNRPAGSDKILLRNWWASANGVTYRRDLLAVVPAPLIVTP